jgi:hypothetical protein
MEDPQEQAGRWRLRADEIRTIARSMRRSFARCSLLDVADQWERMAENAERRAGRSSDERTKVADFQSADLSPEVAGAHPIE